MSKFSEPFTVTKKSVSDVAGLKQALAEIAAIREVGAGQPITVELEGGDYFLTESVKIGPEVSAVTIEPKAGAKVRFIGGIAVKDFKEDTYNGTACYSAPIPEGLAFSDFYVNGTRADYTRYPEEGFLYAKDVEDHDLHHFSGSHWFIAYPGDFPATLKNPKNVIVSFCHFWIDEHTPIGEYDEATGKVTFAYRSRFSIAGDKTTPSCLEYYLENVAETFGKPNQWYADEGRVYYVPREGVTLDNIDAYIPVTHKLFEICGTAQKPVEHIHIRNIDMLVTRGDYSSVGNVNGQADAVQMASDGQAVANAGGSVHFKYAHGCTMSGCSLKNFGLHGICMEPGCVGVRLDHIFMQDGGAGGVKMLGGAYGCAPEEETHDCTVTDCTIDHCGRRYFAACGVLMMHTFRCSVEHCDIGNLYYTGVSCGWRWGYDSNIARDNRIVKNHIHHLGMGMLSDMGGVYLLGKQPGTVVANNLIHDIRSKNYGGWALYPDEGSSYLILENNVCYNTSDNSFHQHYGSMNTVRNNILAFADEAIVRITRPEEHVSMLMDTNIYLSDGAPMYRLEAGHLENKVPVTHNNLLWDMSQKFMFTADKTVEEGKALGFDTDCVIADPKFADPKNGDFTLAEDSPAYAMGFKKINLSDVGPRKK